MGNTFMVQPWLLLTHVCRMCLKKKKLLFKWNPTSTAIYEKVAESNILVLEWLQPHEYSITDSCQDLQISNNRRSKRSREHITEFRLMLQFDFEREISPYNEFLSCLWLTCTMIYGICPPGYILNTPSSQGIVFLTC